MDSHSILVTGAAGLIGNAVRLALERAGRNVIAVDRMAKTDDGLQITECDLTEIIRLHEIIDGRPLWGVIHCGALSGPMVARDNPSAMVAVNIVGTENVLEVARACKASRFVYCSSTSAYGETPDGVITEDVPLHPSSLYGASKAASEHLVAAYRSQYGLDGVSLRLSWVYGPRRKTDCVIRTMINNALDGVPTKIEFGRHFYRQFIHVDDASRALISALDTPNLPRTVYNVTGNSYLTILEVACVIRSLFPTADITICDGDDPVDDKQSRFDISAAQRDFGYLPKLSFVEGVRAYADWLKNHRLG